MHGKKEPRDPLLRSWMGPNFPMDPLVEMSVANCCYASQKEKGFRDLTIVFLLLPYSVPTAPSPEVPQRTWREIERERERERKKNKEHKHKHFGGSVPGLGGVKIHVYLLFGNILRPTSIMNVLSIVIFRVTPHQMAKLRARSATEPWASCGFLRYLSSSPSPEVATASGWCVKL